MADPNQCEHYLKVIRDIILAVHGCTDLPELCQTIIHKLVHACQVHGGLFLIYNHSQGRFEKCAHQRLKTSFVSKEQSAAQGLLHSNTNLQKIKIITKFEQTKGISSSAELRAQGINQILEIPLAVENSQVGLIRLYLKTARVFKQDEQSFLLTISDLCASMVKRFREIKTQQMQFSSLVSQMEKMSSLGRMTAGIVHEINNPLTGILLYSSNMRKKAEHDSFFAEALDIVVQETKRCKKIIQRLLDFARDNQPEKTMSSLNQVLDKALSLLENEFHIHRIKLKKETTPDLPAILIDEAQIEQVLVNILLNAVQAIGHQGQICVRSYQDPAQKVMVIEIEDNGCGISSEELKKIFSPFYSKKVNGTGLGLSISLDIMQAHGGEIKILSQPGQGTKFFLIFPYDKT